MTNDVATMVELNEATQATTQRGWLHLARGHLKLHQDQRHVGLRDAAAKSLSRALQCLAIAKYA